MLIDEQQLIIYIHRARKVGFNDERIRDTLLQNGWPESVIERAIQLSSSANARTRHAALLFIIVVATVAMAAGSLLLAAHIRGNNANRGWLKYHDSQYGLSFLYPASYTYVDETKTSVSVVSQNAAPSAIVRSIQFTDRNSASGVIVTIEEPLTVPSLPKMRRNFEHELSESGVQFQVLSSSEVVVSKTAALRILYTLSNLSSSGPTEMESLFLHNSHYLIIVTALWPSDQPSGRDVARRILDTVSLQY